MPATRYFFYFLIIFLFAATDVSAQSIKGRVQDDKNAGIAYATVYIKELRQGIATNEKGDFEIKTPQGSYSLVVQSLGYEVQHISVQVPQPAPLVITLAERAYALRAVAVSAKGEDPAYMIMRKAIGMAPYYRNIVSGYTADVYLKTKAKVEHIKGVIALGLRMEGINVKELAGTNIVQESINEISFTAPDQYRQKVKSKTSATSIDLAKYGINENDLTVGLTRLDLYGTSPSLPLSTMAFSNYKFVYEGDNVVDGKIINKIKVIPRRKSNDLVSGYLYIMDKTWNVYNADLLQKTSINNLRIQQNYSEVEPGILLPVSYTMEFTIDGMGIKGAATMAGSIKYLSVDINHRIQRQPIVTVAKADTVVKKTNPKKEKLRQEVEKIAEKEQINNRDMRKLAKLEQQLAEISEEEQRQDEGKEKSLEIERNYVLEEDSSTVRNDTALFNSLRTIPLAADEWRTYQKYDSIVKINPRDSTGEAVHKGKNQGWFSILMMGTPSTKLNDGLYMKFGGLLSINALDFNVVDGYSYGLSGGLRKQYEKTGRRWWLNGDIKWAFSRQVPLWNLSFQHLYHPGRRAFWEIKGGQDSKDFAGYNGVGFVNAFSSLLFRMNYANFYHDNYVRLTHQTDIVNGLTLNTALQWSDRRALQNITDESYFYQKSRDYRPNIPRNADVAANPALLSDNRAAVLDIALEYTPEYYYRKRGERKIMAHSRYPTFSLLWEKGIPDIFNSVSDFDLLQFKITQNFKFGYYNEFNYTAGAGNFFNTRHMAFADYTHFYGNEAGVSFNDHSQSIPYQLLPQYTYSTNNWYVGGYARYQSPLLALKYIPFLTNVPFNENLHVSYLLQPNLRHYTEIGYGWSFANMAGVGVHAGFSANGFYGWGFRLLINFDSIQ